MKNPPLQPKYVGLSSELLLFCTDRSCCVPYVETIICRQIRLLKDSAAFASVQFDQREILVESLAQTLARAEYHFQRYRSLRRTLDELRDWAPGEIAFSTAAHAIYYEVQALTGVARAIVDQLLFLVLSRYDSNPSNRKENRWEATTIFKGEVKSGAEVDVPEIHCIRRYRTWFDRLNAYRSEFFHAARRHGSGHYNEDRRAAKLPQMNFLLVPDRASLSARSRPWNWTWNDRSTIDDVANLVHDDLVAMLSDICANEWHTEVPPEGSVPADNYPDLTIALPSPAVIHHKDVAFVPLFSSRDRAVLFAKQLQTTFASANELIEFKSNSIVVGTEAITFSLAGQNFGSARVIHVYLDPEPIENNWGQVRATIIAHVDAAGFAAEPIQVMSMPVDQPISVFAWHTPMLIT